MLNRGGPLSKLVSGTIGLAHEYRASVKDHKGQEKQASTGENDEDGDGDENGDGEDWALDLDEAQQMQMSTDFNARDGDATKDDFDVDLMLQSFLQRHPAELKRTSSNPLKMDVLLPQRRIKSQHKGFVHAYAPVLDECDIDQETWLEFLDGLEKSISKSSWFHATNAAIMVASTAAALTLGISPVVHMVSMAIHASVELSRRGYLNFQQNKYLDVMNDQFFKPRGLYCMVIKYRPTSNEILEGVDLNQNISRSFQQRDGKNQWKGMVSSSSMTVSNDMEIPSPAPLVFPRLDEMNEVQTTASIKQFGRVMQDYMDRRAASKFESENPNDKLPSAPRKEYASVYGDPNSAANSGGFISLATGGRFNPVGPSGTRHDMRREKLSARKEKGKQKRAKRPMSKMLKSEALYLMVTNLPSKQVLEDVGAELESAG